MRPPAGRGGPPRIVYFYLAVIVVTWAANWPMMKLALGDAPPLVFVLLRLVGTIVLLAPALRAMRVPLLPIPGERLGLFWVGQLQVAAFLVFAILGLSIEAAGRAIVLAYTFSLWAIPIGLLLGVERLGRFHLIGAAIGFAGLVLFMNPTLVDWTSARTLLGNAFLLLSAMTWALGSCLYRRRIWRTPFWTQTFWQLAVSAPIVIVFALPQIGGDPIHWIAGPLCDPRLQLGRHDRARIFPVGGRVDGDAGRSGRAGLGADPGWRVSDLIRDLRGRRYCRCHRRDCADRGRHHPDAAPLIPPC